MIIYRCLFGVVKSNERPVSQLTPIEYHTMMIHASITRWYRWYRTSSTTLIIVWRTFIISVIVVNHQWSLWLSTPAYKAILNYSYQAFVILTLEHNFIYVFDHPFLLGLSGFEWLDVLMWYLTRVLKNDLVTPKLPVVFRFY